MPQIPCPRTEPIQISRPGRFLHTERHGPQPFRAHVGRSPLDGVGLAMGVMHRGRIAQPATAWPGVRQARTTRRRRSGGEPDPASGRPERPAPGIGTGKAQASAQQQVRDSCAECSKSLPCSMLQYLTPVDWQPRFPYVRRRPHGRSRNRDRQTERITDTGAGFGWQLARTTRTGRWAICWTR